MPRDEQATRALTSSAPRGAPIVSGYQVLRELGRGGMGVVYEARQTRLGRRVALKVVDLLRGSDDDDYLAARLGDEARALARLNHPNLVQVYDAGDADGRLWVALELVEGVDAAAWLHDRGPFAAAAALAVVLDAARGLAHVHAAGLVHRDVKPSNLLLAPAGSGDGRSFPWIAKVADLGLARAAAGQGEATSSGLIVGSPAYMAPEQADGREVDHRTDVYALGATLFHLLTGKVPFGSGTPAEILWQKHGTPLPDPTPLVQGAPAGLGRVLDRMLARSPAERYGSDADLVADLEALLAGREPAATWVPREGSSLQRSQGRERTTTRAWRALGGAPRRPGLRLVAGLVAVATLAAAAAQVSRSTLTPATPLALDRSGPRPQVAATPASVQTNPVPVAALPATANPPDAPPASTPPTGRLALTSVPTASLLVDEAWVGTGTVSRGAHVVEALAPGHDPTRAEVLADAADRTPNLAPTRVEPLRRLVVSPDHGAPVWNPRRAVLDQWRIVGGAWRADPAAAGLTGVAEGPRASTARISLERPLARGRLGAAWRLEWQLLVPTGVVAEVALDLGADARAVLVVEERVATLLTRAPGTPGQLAGRELLAAPPGYYRLDWDGEVVVAMAGSARVGAVRVASPSGAPALELVVRGGEATFAGLELVGLQPED